MPDERVGMGAGQLRRGTSVGRYVVLGLIGRGGMGEVYAAYDPELNRKVAIKLLNAGGADLVAVRGRRRLLREAQALARLSHPNVVVIHDVGTIEESVFLAMEFLEGQTLGQWLREARRGWRDVLDVYMAAGRGLVAAHAAGLIHRDFKPDNVMIAASGQVRVMDFGLARGDEPASQCTTGPESRSPCPEAESAPPDGVLDVLGGTHLEARLTETGAFLGTPAYMAPEQLVGDQCDARSDQFSFAVALWEALHGERPFAGKNLAHLIVNVNAGAIQDPPSDTRTPGWIRRILRRSLKVARNERFPSMAELLTQLGRDPAIQRRKWLVAAAASALVVLTAFGTHRVAANRRLLCAGGPGRSSAAWGPERRHLVAHAFRHSGNANAEKALKTTTALMDEYVAKWLQHYTEACEATHVRGEQSPEVLDLRMRCLDERLSRVHALGEVLASADAQVVENAVAAVGGLPLLSRCSDVPTLRAVLKPPEDPKTRSRVDELRADVAKVHALAASGKCERASVTGDRVVVAAADLGYQPLLAEALLAAGRLGEFCSDTGRAVEYLEDAAHAAELSHHDEAVIEASIFSALFYVERLNEPTMARRLLRHAEAVLARLSPHPILDAWLSSTRAVVFLRTGRPASAIAEGRRVLKMVERERGPEHPDVVVVLQNLGVALFEDGQLNEAEATTRRALDLTRRLAGDDNVRTAGVLLNHGEILTALHRLAEARESINQALAVARTQNASAYFLGSALLIQGRLQIEEGEAESARTTLGVAAKIAGTIYPQLAAEVDFARARATWPVLRERRQSLRLAHHARQAMSGLTGAERKVSEIDGWLASASHAPAWPK